MASYSEMLLGGSPQQEPQQPQQPARYSDMLLNDSKPTNWRDQAVEAEAQRAAMPDVAPRNPEGDASFMTQTTAAVADDPRTKVRVFARNRFPNLPEEEAVARYGIVGGNVFYVGDDGDLYPEVSEGVLPSLKQLGAELTARSPSLVLGTAGAIAGATGGPAGMVGGAALGGAGGEGIRKTVANLALDEPQTVTGNIKAMAKEGALEGAFTYGGHLFGKALERKLASDIGRLNEAETARLGSLAEKEGIPLTPAEQTGLKSLTGQQKRLQYLPASQDILDDFVRNRNPKISDAMYRFMGTLTDESSPLLADRAGNKAAKQALDSLQKEADDAARPLYEEAYKEIIDPDAMRRLMADPVLRSAASRVSRTPAYIRDLQRAKNVTQPQQPTTETVRGSLGEQVERGLPATPRPPGAGKDSVKFWDLVKRNLDDQIEKALERPGNRNTVRILQGAKEDLVKQLDQVSPKYAEARATYERAMRPLDEARASLVGNLAKLTDENAVKGAKVLFSTQNSSPEAILEARKLFARLGQDGSQSWNKLVRAHLQTELEALKDSAGDAAVNLGGQLRKNLFGSVQKRRMLEAALPAEQYRALSDLMSVLSATGRAFGANSWTAFEQQAMREMQREAGGAVGTISRVMTPTKIPGAIRDWWMDMRLGKYAGKLAEVITSPEGIKQLRQLRKLSPNDRRFIAGVTALLGPASSAANAAPESDSRPQARQ